MVFVSRIGNSPIVKYLDVEEAESSLLHARLFLSGLEVPKDAAQIEIPFGIDTFQTPSVFSEKDLHRDNFLGSFRPRLVLPPPCLAIPWSSRFLVFTLMGPFSEEDYLQ